MVFCIPYYQIHQPQTTLHSNQFMKLNVAEVIAKYNLGFYVSLLLGSKCRQNPYHNVGHMFHVFYECYDAVVFYGLDEDRARILLIAALLHDFDHPGAATGQLDSENIFVTINSLLGHWPDEDLDIKNGVIRLIKCTEFPHQGEVDTLGQVLRDADRSQAFASQTSYIDVLIGLGRESFQLLSAKFFGGQIGFLRSLIWNTDWAKEKYPPAVIEAKIAEYGLWQQLLTVKE